MQRQHSFGIVRVSRMGLSSAAGSSDQQQQQPEAVPLDATVSNNVARFSLPLPSGAKTIFHVPLHHSIRQLDGDIRAEDRALTVVRLFSDKGDAIASSTPLGVALRQPCKLLLNDQLYSFPALLPSGSAGDVTLTAEQDHHLHQLLARSAAALEVAEGSLQRRQEALHRLQSMEDKLKGLDEKRALVERRGRQAGHRLAWLGLGFMGLQFGFLARLTWWEYSWDIMEPVTYFVGYGTSMVMFAYYVLTRQELSGPAVSDRKMRLIFAKEAARQGLDIQAYNNLVDEVDKLEKELRSLQ